MTVGKKAVDITVKVGLAVPLGYIHEINHVEVAEVDAVDEVGVSHAALPDVHRHRESVARFDRFAGKYGTGYGCG